MISLFLAIGNPILPGREELAPFLPELILTATVIGILLAPFFTRRSNLAAALVALAGLLLALFSLPFAKAASNTLGGAFHPLLVSDSFAILWKAMLLIFTAGVVLMWFSTTAATLHEGDGPEFFTLLIGATIGMCLMGSTSNLLMLFLSVEMASLPSYVLAGFRKTNRIGSEASLKYVLFGAATGAIMAYGLSMLYGLYGTLQVEEIGRQLAVGTGGAAVPLIVAIAGILVGIGFKISAVPLHFWCPDVFEGAGVDVSVFLSVASKGAGLSLLLRVLMSMANGANFVPSSTLTGIAVAVGIIGSITATVGNTGALVQNNIKRLLAYSSIAHAGYMMCALSLLVKTNDVDVASAALKQSILLYLAVYLFMNLGAFTVAGLIYRATGSEDIRDYAGLGKRNPVLAICMLDFMVSLVGLPPFAGFVAKLNVMYVLGQNGSWWWVLVAVIGINTIFSLYYYVRVLRMMYLVDSDQPSLNVNPLGAALSVVCALMLILMLLGFNPLQRLTTNYGHINLPTQQIRVPAVAEGR